jgi:hypothetical protein
MYFFITKPITSCSNSLRSKAAPSDANSAPLLWALGDNSLIKVNILEKLFSYGTLQTENVQKETFGGTLTGTKDTLVGYVLSEITIKDKSVIEKSGTNLHPILKLTENPLDEVEVTILDITQQELHQADEYEVEEYARIDGNFKSGNKAWVYADASQITNT